MNDSVGYESSQEVLADRVRWAVALLARLVQRGRVEGWLDGEVAAGELPDPEAIAARSAERLVATPQDPAILTMQWLATRLRLSAPELDALWLLACVELAPAATRLAASLGAEVSVQTLAQAVAVRGGELDRLSARGLVELATDARLPQHRRWVRASDRVVDLARGELGLDRELAGVCELVMPDEVSARAAEVPAAIARALEAACVLVAQGPAGSGRATLLLNAAARQAAGVLRVRGGELARDGERRGRQLRAIAREAAVFGVLPLVEDVDVLGDDGVAAMDRELVRRCAGPVLVTARAGVRLQLERPTVVHALEAPGSAARAAIWRRALPGCEGAVIEVAAGRYTATPGTIVAAATAAVARAGGAGRVSVEDVHEGLCAHVDAQLAELATRVRCTQTWKDLVLPSDQLEQVAELVARVRHRARVLDDWGFADKVGRGLGLAVLLSGPPGTGKTMIAGLIARELGLDLYQVDLSRIVSKYIGETEQNLARVFDAAETGHAILLFDEADALFAKRSDVKSSNDRYANLEVNFLLQRIEQFAGISMLTTNHERSIDEAFRRRLAIHVRFPTPDADQREHLWRAMVPERARVAADVDFRQLADELAMTGGYIKNAVLRAAYLAVDEDAPISMAHLWRAARREYEAMGKLVTA